MKMLPPARAPHRRDYVHPWIASLIDQDASVVASALQQRLSSTASPEVAQFGNRLQKLFEPCQIILGMELSYVLCLKKSRKGKPSSDVTDLLYIAEPLSEQVINERSSCFHESVRPLLRDFLAIYSGCGEDMPEECAGQFAIEDEPAWPFFEEDLGEWKNARCLYRARNGDAVLVNERGATAWHALETREIEPLFDSFPKFMKHYAEFRATSNVFDSWASRDFL